MIVFLEAQGTNAYNRYAMCPAGNNNKDEDNSPKNLNDKNQQASSQKFRQLMSYFTVIILFDINHLSVHKNSFQVQLFNISKSLYQVSLCKINNVPTVTNNNPLVNKWKVLFDPTERAPTGSTKPSFREPGSNGNEGVLNIL